MTRNEIKLLTPSERVAGYIVRNARVSEIGARLRKNGRSDYSWTRAEYEEFGAACDELDAWYLALSKEEKKAIVHIDIALVYMCRGEWSVVSRFHKFVMSRYWNALLIGVSLIITTISIIAGSHFSHFGRTFVMAIVFYIIVGIFTEYYQKYIKRKHDKIYHH